MTQSSTSPELITLKIKQRGGISESVQVHSHETGAAFRTRVSNLVGAPGEDIRLLCRGKFLKDSPSLAQQGAKDGSTVMILLKPSQQEQKKFDDSLQEAKFKRIAKEVVFELAEREDGGTGKQEKHFFEIENQAGEKLQISSSDRKALIVGMTLHEQGRALLKEKKYSEALEVFLEAAQSGFDKVSPDILGGIDNDGYLQLDIAWTYYKLQDPKYLEDTEKALFLARKRLEASHGPSMERLQLIKQDACPEIVLYVRLHLLEGIVLYYKQQVESARGKLAQAQSQLARLAIDEAAFTELLNMGFEDSECRIALRACGNNSARAVQYILERQQKRSENREMERQRKRKRQQALKYGKTAEGNLVNLQLLKDLQDMGFNKSLVAEALRQADNDKQQSIILLTESPHLLVKQPEKSISESQISLIVSMGFSQELAMGTLAANHGNTQAAIEQLLEGKGVSCPQAASTSSREGSGCTTTAAADSDSTDGTVQMDEEVVEQEESTSASLQSSSELRRQVEAQLVKHIPDEEEYLDLQLEEEGIILQQYLDLIEKFGRSEV